MVGSTLGSIDTWGEQDCYIHCTYSSYPLVESIPPHTIYTIKFLRLV